MAIPLTPRDSNESTPEALTRPFLTQKQLKCLRKFHGSFQNDGPGLFYDENLLNLIYKTPAADKESSTLVIETTESVEGIVEPSGQTTILSAAQINGRFQELIMLELMAYLVPSNEYDGYREITDIDESVDALKEFLTSGILTDENIQILLNAIIDSYFIPERYSWNALRYTDELLPIMSFVRDKERLSSPEIQDGIIRLLEDPHNLECIANALFMHDEDFLKKYNFESYLNEFKDVGVVFSDANIDKLLLILYDDCVKNFDDESFWSFFIGYESRIRGLLANRHKALPQK